MTGPILEIAGLTAGPPGMTLVSGVDLTVGSGEIVALLGANGAGKTTLLRAIMGLMPVLAGTCRFRGEDLAGATIEDRAGRGIGYCPEGRRLFPGLTVAETLALAADLGPMVGRAERADVVRALFPALKGLDRQRAWVLSGGQQQMLAIARALLVGPRLLLLDEPSLGLAPALVTDVMTAVQAIAGQGTAVLLSEQNIPAATGIADRALILSEGRVAYQGSPEGLADRVAADPMSFGL